MRVTAMLGHKCDVRLERGMLVSRGLSAESSLNPATFVFIRRANFKGSRRWRALLLHLFVGRRAAMRSEIKQRPKWLDGPQVP